MDKKIMLTPLFVLNLFLVGMVPKTSKAGPVNKMEDIKQDSAGYTIKPDSSYVLPQSCNPEFAKSFAQELEANAEKDSVFYTISWQGKFWVKYTSDDGSGFIRTGGSRTWRNMNPGAIRPCKITEENGACGTAGGFAVFPSEEQGMNALRAVLLSNGYRNLTLAAAIHKYAPPSDRNNTRAYQNRLSRMTGLRLTKRIKELTNEELESVMLAIKEIEGWEPGENAIFDARNLVATNTFDCTRLLSRQKQRAA